MTREETWITFAAAAMRDECITITQCADAAVLCYMAWTLLPENNRVDEIE